MGKMLGKLLSRAFWSWVVELLSWEEENVLAVDGPVVDAPAIDDPAVDGLAVDCPAVDGPAVDDLATAAGIGASDGSVAPAVERTAYPSRCALWSSCRVLSGCSSMSRTTGIASSVNSAAAKSSSRKMLLSKGHSPHTLNPLMALSWVEVRM